MIIPSENLHKYLLVVSHGIFFEPVNIGTKHYRIDLVAKLPTEIIKFISVGSSIFLSIKLVPIRNCFALCTTFAVEDDPEAMFYILRTHDPVNIDIIVEFLEQNQIELHTFDELNRNIATFKGSIAVDCSNIKNLQYMKPLIVELLDQERSLIIEHFEREIAHNSSILRLIRFKLDKIDNPNWYHTRFIADAPKHDHNRFEEPYNLCDNDPGKQFEINLTRLLSEIFDPESLFPSPFGATPDSENREFIDIVADGKDYLCFFEAKVTDITPTSIHRSTERRVGSLEKKIQKATRQLRGAYKNAIHNGILTLGTDTINKEIKVSIFSNIHLIIVISEVHPDLTNSDVIENVISLANELNVSVHVLDLHTLSMHVKQCKDVKEFGEILNNRWILSLKHNIIKFRDE